MDVTRYLCPFCDWHDDPGPNVPDVRTAMASTYPGATFTEWVQGISEAVLNRHAAGVEAALEAHIASHVDEMVT